VEGEDHEHYASRAVVVDGRCGEVVHGEKAALVDGVYDIHMYGPTFRVHKDATELTVGSGIAGTSDAPITFVVNGSSITIGPNGAITIDAGSELALTCGGASITLASSGTVAITGSTSVTASAGPSTLELAMSGANLAGPIIRIN
jgi:hypothetical protein